MNIDIVVPQVGEAVSEVTLVKWLKQEGDTIKKGDILFEVDTDKAIVEVEAFAGGTLARILVPDQSPVMPQQVVGVLRPGEEAVGMSQASRQQASTRSAKRASAEDKVSPMARRVAAELGVEVSSVAGTGPGGRVKAEDVRRFAAQQPQETPTPPDLERPKRVPASPKARRLARELGVDLATLSGTGVDGLITVEDVQAAAPSTAPAPAPGPVSAEANLEVRPLTKLRQAIAARTQASKQTVPHIYLMAEVDMTQAQQLRAYCHQTLGWERPPTYTDIMVRACALALAAMPQVNVFYTEEGLAQRQTVDIGVAVDVAGGLIVPVLPRADRLSLGETSAQIHDLARRARQGRLREADLAQKSMVVSNLGMYGVDAFVAIIDMPDPMILAVGQVVERIVPLNGQPAIRAMCTLTLSVDHRALDGVPGAQFLARVKHIVENPFELLAREA